MKAIVLNEPGLVIKELKKYPSLSHKKRLINERDQFGRTILAFALMKGNFELCEILLRNGAETLFKDFQGRSLLHLACLHGVDKRLINLVLDYKRLQDAQDTHLDEAKQDKFHGTLFDRLPSNV